MGMTTGKRGKDASKGRAGDTHHKRIRDMSNMTLVAVIMTLYLSVIVATMVAIII